MGERIVIIQGHPDDRARHFGQALADAYAEGAERGGHRVERIEVAALAFPLVRRKADWEDETPPEAIQWCQARLREADHIVLFYPLWLGTMPALLKGFLEQLLRPEFAFGRAGQAWRPGLKGRSARSLSEKPAP